MKTKDHVLATMVEVSQRAATRDAAHVTSIAAPAAKPRPLLLVLDIRGAPSGEHVEDVDAQSADGEQLDVAWRTHRGWVVEQTKEEELDAFVARRKAEGGAPTDF